MNKPVLTIDPKVMKLRDDFSRLVAERNSYAEQLNRINGFLVCLLRLKHNGKAFIPQKEMEDNNGLGVKWEAIGPLQSIRLTVVNQAGESVINDPTDDSINPEDIPVQVTPDGGTEAQPAPAPDVPSPGCGAEWHRIADAFGRRCPECGSAEKNDVPA